MDNYSNFAAMLSSEFHLYLIEHHKDIAKNALIIFQIEGENEFNKWHASISLINRESNQPLIYGHLKKWRRHSSIEQIRMRMSA